MRSSSDAPLSQCFWQKAELELFLGHDHISVATDDCRVGFVPYYYLVMLRSFGRQTVRRLLQAMKRFRYGRGRDAGAKGKVDWEIILIETASHMYEEGLPKSLTELCNHIENSFAGVTPGKTQLEIHLGPLYCKFSKVDGK